MTAVSSVTLSEWQSVDPDPDSVLSGRVLSGPRERALAELLADARMLEVSELRAGLSIRSFSYVGRVRLGDVEVTIQPKLEGVSLLHLLRYAYGFRKLNLLAEADQSLDRTGFADLIVAQLVAEVQELLTRGLHRAYVGQKDWLSSPRGMIDIGALARQGGFIDDRLPCVHHPRIEDTLLNRVLLGGLTLAEAVATDLGLRRQAHRLATVLSVTLPSIRLTLTLLDRATASLNRLTSSYTSATTLIRLLFESQGVVLEDVTGDVKLPGFLFDMNRFFQALLARFLRDNLHGYEVRDEHQLRGMVEFVPGYNPRNRQAPVPRPDFAIFDMGHPIAILDAKYRDLWERPLPREMLYQLAMYAKPQHVKEATILYPTMLDGAKEAWIVVRDPVFADLKARINLRPVHLPLLEKLIADSTSASGTRAIERHARWLITGH